MSSYPFMQVDAFTTQALSGNPCAVIFETDTFSDDLMLSLAREMNLSETAFVRRSSIATFGVRYFTPAEEIPMAGHPTIATTFALVASGRLPLHEDYTTISLELPGGPLPVEIYAEQGHVKQIVMTQKKPLFLKQYNPAEVFPLFGLTMDDALPHVPIQTVSTGTPQLMIPLRSQDALRRATLDITKYAQFRATADFFSPHLFCLGGVTPQGKTFARHFGTPPDTLEDPATGSATGGMAAYLWHYGLIDQPTFIAEQGHWMKRPSTISVEIFGSPDTIESEKIGGSAVVVLQGELVL